MTLIALCLFCFAPPAGWEDLKPETLFEGREGSFSLRDLETGETWTINRPFAEKPLTPCSTFKIFNTMAALDEGVVANEATRFKWDGSDQYLKVWERDHNLRTAVRFSVVWYYKKIAREIGAERMQTLLDREQYGNRDISGGIDKFWLKSSLKISAEQQLDFISHLYRDELGFSKRAQAIIRGLIVQEVGNDWVWSGKTGSGSDGKIANLGWFVGYVQSGDKQYVFVFNQEGPGASGMVSRKQVRHILQTLNLLPQNT